MRKLRRWALAASVLIQAAILTALLLRPLFGGTLPLVVHHLVPAPPYRRAGGSAHPQRPVVDRHPHVLLTSHPFSYPVEHLPIPYGDASPEPSDAPWPGSGTANGPPGGLLDIPGTGGPPPPVAPPQHGEQPPAKRYAIPSDLQQARLAHRVDPVYPPLARQTHLEGTVVLHAIIAKDGTVQSLEVLSGHPLFVFAAKSAVAQWRYQPTLLNGQPVEVETQITVIFRMP